MLRVEATIRDHNQIPFSTTWTGTDQISPEPKTHHASSGSSKHSVQRSKHSPIPTSDRTGNLLFLSGMLPTEGHTAKFVGRVGAEFDVETARKAARLAALNGLAVESQYLASLDKITRIVRLGASLVQRRIYR